MNGNEHQRSVADLPLLPFTFVSYLSICNISRWLTAIKHAIYNKIKSNTTEGYWVYFRVAQATFRHNRSMHHSKSFPYWQICQGILVYCRGLQRTRPRVHPVSSRVLDWYIRQLWKAASHKAKCPTKIHREVYVLYPMYTVFHAIHVHQQVSNEDNSLWHILVAQQTCVHFSHCIYPHIQY